jgi:hypothetical protein
MPICLARRLLTSFAATRDIHECDRKDSSFRAISTDQYWEVSAKKRKKVGENARPMLPVHLPQGVITTAISFNPECLSPEETQESLEWYT